MDGFMLNISTDKSLLDIDMIYSFLSKSYWAKHRTKSQVRKSIENSICFGIYIDHVQVGFARVITDLVSFAYLCDLFILKAFREKGYAQQLISFILKDETIKNVENWYLITKDAQNLYRKYGFEEYANNEKVIMSTLKLIRHE